MYLRLIIALVGLLLTAGTALAQDCAPHEQAAQTLNTQKLKLYLQYVGTAALSGQKPLPAAREQLPYFNTGSLSDQLGLLLQTVADPQAAIANFMNMEKYPPEMARQVLPIARGMFGAILEKYDLGLFRYEFYASSDRSSIAMLYGVMKQSDWSADTVQFTNFCRLDVHNVVATPDAARDRAIEVADIPVDPEVLEAACRKAMVLDCFASQMVAERVRNGTATAVFVGSDGDEDTIELVDFRGQSLRFQTIIVRQGVATLLQEGIPCVPCFFGQ